MEAPLSLRRGRTERTDQLQARRIARVNLRQVQDDVVAPAGVFGELPVQCRRPPDGLIAGNLQRIVCGTWWSLTNYVSTEVASS